MSHKALLLPLLVRVLVLIFRSCLFVVLDNTVRYSSSKDSTDCADIKLEAAKPHLEKKASKEKSDKVKTVKEKSMVKKETSKVKESTSSMSRENSMEEILMCGICQVM